ncbi:VanZ like family protein [Halanaeroarchaeum sp. HSR-CO]|uniref:VanZ family protein n=1 Tax=Halanaeroarchaeum sp. HSR-CO TaxID=2866382 RepID=UPI00217DB38A|nr:VanZ family protein [Halanaeroarchaeum sp. HSR-CO]UWG48417.1 VanZ like family protein [Halanaeroarchaeum sp. HSR-CO]
MRQWSTDGRWVAVVAWTLVLLVATLLPAPLERNPKWDPIGPDTVLHFLGHAGYAIALANAFGAARHDKRTAAVLSIAVSAGYGFVIGRLQQWVPGRANEPSDLLAGLFGTCCAVVVWYGRARPSDRSP